MELAVEILDSVYYALVLSRPAMDGFQIPLDSHPDRVASLRIVVDLAYIPYGPSVLGVLKAHVFVQKVLLLILVFDANSLA